MNGQDDQDWDEFDDLEDIDEDDLLQIEWGLPLTGECFVNGVPMSTADYFDVDFEDLGLIVKRLLDIDGVSDLDSGEDQARFYFFEHVCDDGTVRPRDIIGIVTFRGNQLRLETNMPQHTARVRGTIESVLDGLVRHRAQRREEVFNLD